MASFIIRGGTLVMPVVLRPVNPALSRCVRALLWACLMLLPGQGVAADTLMANPNKVEAAFLRNFARYVIWPQQAFVDERSPWKICILGPDPFGEILEATLKDRKEQGRSFVIHRAETPEGLPACQIVFIGYKEAGKRRAALDRLRVQPVLTVGDTPDFLQDGGIVRFNVRDHVEISINLDQARSVALTIPVKVLEVSHEVKESGVVRKWR